MERSKSRQAFRSLLWPVVVYSALVAALILAWRLSRQSADLRAELARSRIAAFEPHVGMPVPAFRAPAVDGDSITLGGESGRRQLLFFFSTTCGFCFESLEGWKAIARRLMTDSTAPVEVIWVSLSRADSTREFVQLNAIEQPVVLMNDRRMAGIYHANLVPLTVLLDRGTVSYARTRAVAAPAEEDSIVSIASVPEVTASAQVLKLDTFCRSELGCR
jgi:peroxiredoxin